MATPGLGRLNEGGARSVVGVAARSSASLLVTSGRDGTRVRALARRVKDTLEWSLGEVVKKGEGGDSPLIGDNLVLTRRPNDEAFTRVTEECNRHFDK